MIKIIDAQALHPYRLYVKFSDGAKGTIDVSSWAGKGVFVAWDDPAFFEQVHINSTGRSLEWGSLIDLCADSLYMSLTGQSVQELFPKLAHEGMRA
jgi:Protein of unknown function (DUF2442)